MIHIMRGPLGLEAEGFNLALGTGILDDMSLRVTHLLQEAQLLAGARQGAACCALLWTRARKPSNSALKYGSSSVDWPPPSGSAYKQQP